MAHQRLFSKIRIRGIATNNLMADDCDARNQFPKLSNIHGIPLAETLKEGNLIMVMSKNFVKQSRQHKDMPGGCS